MSAAVVSPSKAGPPGQHLEEDAAERPDVCALVHGVPARLFGAHVARCPEDASRPRCGALVVDPCSEYQVPPRCQIVAMPKFECTLYARSKSGTLRQSRRSRILMFAGFKIAMDDACFW